MNSEQITIARISGFTTCLLAGLLLLSTGFLTVLLCASYPVHPVFLFLSIGGTFLLLFVQRMRSSGYWGVDEKNIYKGRSLTPFIRIDEIEQTQIGIPFAYRWRHKYDSASMHRALLLRLTADRWFIWSFRGMKNSDAFIEKILNLAPSEGDIPIPEHVLNELTPNKAEDIIHVPVENI